MSFPTVCPSCGAPSGPSVGICPFCRSPIVPEEHGRESAQAPVIGEIAKLYDAGRIDRALSLLNSALTETPELQKDVSLLLMQAKLMVESDAPPYRLQSIVTRALTIDPANAELRDYLDIADAIPLLRRDQADDPGELLLRRVLRRSPDNPHALFLLASHLAWEENQVEEPIRLLSRCVRVRHVFLRAWGCLAALYTQIGKRDLAVEALRRAIGLETDPVMRKQLQSLLDSPVSPVGISRG